MPAASADGAKKYLLFRSLAPTVSPDTLTQLLQGGFVSLCCAVVVLSMAYSLFPLLEGKEEGEGERGKGEGERAAAMLGSFGFGDL